MARVCKWSNRYDSTTVRQRAKKFFLIKFKLAVRLMRRHPDFSGLLAAGEYEIPVPNGIRDKNSFHRFWGMASHRNRKGDRLIFQRKRGIHFLSTKFHLERLQIHSVSKIFFFALYYENYQQRNQRRFFFFFLNAVPSKISLIFHGITKN